MPKFQIKIVEEFSFTVEADTEEEAREEAVYTPWDENLDFFEMKVEEVEDA